MWQRLLYHTLLVRPHVLPGRGTRDTGFWAILYRAINHVVKVRVPCATMPGIRSTGHRPWGPCPWTVLYWAIDHVEHVCMPCYTGPWTISTGPCPGQYCTSLFTMWYTAKYHVLPGREPWCPCPWTILYCAIDHVGHVCIPCDTGLWTRSTELWTMNYSTLDLTVRTNVKDHVLPSPEPYCIGSLTICVPCSTWPWTHSTFSWTMNYWPIDYIVMGHWPYVTKQCTMCYWAHSTWHCNISYWAVDHILPAHGTCGAGPWRRSTGSWNMS